MEQQINVNRALRYYVSGNIKTAKHLVYVLHGYGQLAKFFIRKFNTVANNEIAFIAPEGAHRFYLNGTSGRVGASWMTKEWREQDIKENIESLDKLHQHISLNCNAKKVSILGFSQGGSTAGRWHEYGKVNADNFIFWASVFPPDIDGITEESNFSKSNNYFVIGKDDEYFNKETITAVKQDFKSNNLDFKFIEFEGNHNILEDPLRDLFNQLSSVK